MVSRGACAALALGIAFAVAATGATADGIPCTCTANGKTYDFSSLIASNGSYTWSQTSYQVGGQVRVVAVAQPNGAPHLRRTEAPVRDGAPDIVCAVTHC